MFTSFLELQKLPKSYGAGTESQLQQGMSFPGWNRRKSWKINYEYNGVHFKYYPYEKEYMGLQITKPEERFILGKQSQFITQIWTCHRSLWQVHIFFTWNTYNWSWKSAFIERAF